MTFRFDPRGDLPPMTIQPSMHNSNRTSARLTGSQLWSQDYRQSGESSTFRKRFSSPQLWSPDYNAIVDNSGYHRSHQAPRTKRRPCYDWIFSSGSNVHVALDRSVFKTYNSFKSYVLTVADQRQVAIRGIGTVELKIRCQPGIKESQTITLENVLHVPGWLCNIFSDIYFSPATDYEHTWTDFGVSFLRKEDGKMRYWGFTENFCGLDKLVLAKDPRGRSPMLEDKDREVFSVNVMWPQGQRDRWETLMRAEEQKDRQKQEMKREHQSGLTEQSSMSKTPRSDSLQLQRDHKSGLTEISGNVMKRGPSTRTSSLKAPTSSHSSFREIFQ